MNRRRGEAGFTLVEVLIASTISVLVMSGATMLLYTFYISNFIANSRLQTSGQIRNFQLAFNDDAVLASSSICPATPCDNLTTLKLEGCRFSRGDPSPSNPSRFTAVYKWWPPTTSSPGTVSRTVGGSTIQVARNVPGFTADVAGDNSVTVTLTVQDSSKRYSQTQTLYFHPRPAKQVPPCA
jgi:prepilin-type N-terminal cleavage/methylation domain-containing protein